MKICVYGKLRAGKSEVCKVLSKYYNCQVLDFGDSLKESLAAAYPETVGQPKNRALLVKFGQHLRKLDDDIWVNTVKHKIKKILEENQHKNILVTGLRQMNEYKMLKEEGFIFIRVEAKESTRIKRCIEAGDNFSEEDLRAPIETELDKFEYDYLIENERGFKELEISIENLICSLNSELERKIRDAVWISKNNKNMEEEKDDR